MKLLLIFTLCLMSDGGASNEVTGYSGGGVVIKCKYETRYKLNAKYFCKGSPSRCFDQIKTDVKKQWETSGRFSLFDDTDTAEFWVMIRKITVQDTETFQCGVDIKLAADIYIPVVLKVEQGTDVTEDVTAYAGGRVNIKCRYGNKYNDKPKSLCKIGTHQGCIKQTHTQLKIEWSHDHRFSIQENRSAGFFSVFIRDLITEDTGTYACGVVVSDEIEIYTVVELNVREDHSYGKSTMETVHVGGDLTLGCKYPESLSNDTKILCKTRLLCSYEASVNESDGDVNDGKVSLYDDREKHLLNITIKNVTEIDSDEYWCGADRGSSDHGYKVYFTRINLRVIASPSETTQGSVVFSSSLSSSSSSLTPTLASAGLSPVSIVITVLANILIGLLIGSTCLFVILRIKRKRQGHLASLERNVVAGSGNIHEELKDTRCPLTSETSTNLSDPSQSVYSNIVFPTSTCDSGPVSGAHLPTKSP